MKKFRTALSIVMAILLLMTSTVLAAPKEGIVYTALGDSIAFGTGGTDGIGYTDYFNDHLSKVYGEGNYLKLAQNGLTSSDLLGSLLGPTDPYGVQAAVADSDLITISIGGNDLLGPFLEGFIGLVFDHYYSYPAGIDIESLMADLEGWQADPMNSDYQHFNALLYSLSTTAFPAGVSGFSANWPQTIARVKALNPDAAVYVNTVYNPFVNIPLLHDFADPFIQGLNAPIIGCAEMYGYKVVDVYSEFEEYGNPVKLAVGDLSNLAEFFVDPNTVPVPLHPTDMGYKFICNMHKDLME